MHLPDDNDLDHIGQFLRVVTALLAEIRKWRNRRDDDPPTPGSAP